MRASVSKRSVSRCSRMRLALQVGEEGVAGGDVVLCAGLEHLDGGDDRGERRAQLVRGVGEEPPLGCLAVALRRAIRHDDETRSEWVARRAARRAAPQIAATRRLDVEREHAVVALPSRALECGGGPGPRERAPALDGVPRSSPAAGLMISTMPVGSSAMTPSSSRLRTADNPPRSRSTTANASRQALAHLVDAPGERCRSRRESRPAPDCRNRPSRSCPAALARRRTRRVTRLATARLTTTASVTAMQGAEHEPLRAGHRSCERRGPCAGRTRRAPPARPRACAPAGRRRAKRSPSPVGTKRRPESATAMARDASGRLRRWMLGSADVAISRPFASSSQSDSCPSRDARASASWTPDLRMSRADVVGGARREAECRILGERPELVIGGRHDVEGDRSGGEQADRDERGREPGADAVQRHCHPALTTLTSAGLAHVWSVSGFPHMFRGAAGRARFTWSRPARRGRPRRAEHACYRLSGFGERDGGIRARHGSHHAQVARVSTASRSS